MKIRAYCAAAALLLAVAGAAVAATTASQGFTVIVPTSLSITAPAAATLTHNETDDNQTFPAQTWVVKGNVLSGVNVSFATSSAFVHATNNTFKRNAQLGLAVGASQGPATWTVSKATDSTDYGANDEVAAVTATSNGVGRANFDLTVSFITGTYGEFAAGNYNLTVVGTVAAN